MPAIGVLVLGGGAVAGYAALASADSREMGEGRGMGMGMFQKGSHVDGVITAISGTTLTITADADHSGGTYTIDASNATVTKGGAQATLSSFAVGDKVWAKGTITGTNVVATSITDAMHKGFGPGGRHGKGPGAHGTVTSVNGSTLTISGQNGTTYTVDAGSATVEKMVAGSLSDIKVGDTIGVHGTVSGNTITAVTIMDDLAIPTPSQN